MTEIQQDLTKESSKHVRHALRHASRPPSPPAAAASSGSSGPTPNGVNGEDGLERIAAGHAELERLASERVVLAKRVVALVTRTRTRLEGDLVRIGVLQGEVDVKVATGAATPTMATMAAAAAAAATTTTATTMTAMATTTPPPEMYVLHGRNPAVAISESLRHALSGGDGPSPKSEYGGGRGRGRCADDDGTERRVQTSIKLPSTTGTGYARSRLSRQIHPVRSALEEEGDADAEGEEEDAEGEEVEEGDGEEGDDQQIYCFCQKLSYGEVSCVCCASVCAGMLKDADDCMRQRGVSVSMGRCTVVLWMYTLSRLHSSISSAFSSNHLFPTGGTVQYAAAVRGGRSEAMRPEIMVLFVLIFTVQNNQ